MCQSLQFPPTPHMPLPGERARDNLSEEHKFESNTCSFRRGGVALRRRALAEEPDDKAEERYGSAAWEWLAGVYLMD